MSRLLEAVALLEQADWEGAHAIAQNDPSPLGSWAHGIVHLMEGDRANADYWYRRAGRPLPQKADLEDEIAALKRRVEPD